MLDKKYYQNHLDVVENNYQEALKYVNYEQRIVTMLEEIFKLNGVFE